MPLQGIAVWPGQCEKRALHFLPHGRNKAPMTTAPIIIRICITR